MARPSSWNAPKRALEGMRGFSVIWAGQLLSLTGSAMTTFGLTVWLWQETGQATAVALHAFFSFAPSLLVGAFAGVVVDRWNRKWVMLLSDIATGLGTLGVFLLLSSGRLEVWHLYALGAWSGAVGAFQVPAFAAAVATLVPKDQYARANGMRSLASSSAQIAAPVLAGVLIAFSGIATILLIDLTTLVLATLALLLVRVPNHRTADGDARGEEDLLGELLAGFRFLARHRGLLGLTLAFTALQFFGMLGVTVLAPMILTRTGGNEAAYGLVSAAIGVGGVAGALLVSIQGGPRRQARAIGLGIAAGSTGLAALGMARGLLGWSLSAAAAFFFFPLVGAASGAIKQRKVPPVIQGRVFAADQLLQTVGIALGILVAGPLADHLFEPAFATSHGWGASFAWLVGAGPGAGMSLLLALAGACGVATGIAAIFSRSIRDIETTVPDYDVAVVATRTAECVNSRADGRSS